MKIMIIVTSILLLSGCGTCPPVKEPEVVVKVEYITKLPPAETLTIPPVIETPLINEKGEMMQSDIAKWILLQEKRMLLLEDKIKSIGKFYYEQNN